MDSRVLAGSGSGVALRPGKFWDHGGLWVGVAGLGMLAAGPAKLVGLSGVAGLPSLANFRSY